MRSAPFFAILAVFILALLGCGPAAPPPRTPGPPKPTRPAPGPAVPASLERLATALQKAPSRCEEVCCFRQLPEWAPLQVAPGEHAATLRGLIKAPGTAPIQRALALRWLAAERDVAELELIESRLGDATEAWRVPRWRAIQRVVPCPQVDTWTSRTVGQVALEAAGAIVGQQRRTVAEYRAWRKLHPDVRDALSYWQQRFPPLARGKGCEAALEALAGRDIRLLLRLVLALHQRYPDPRPTCPRPAQLRPLLAARLQGGGLLTLLSEPARWKADADPAYAGQTNWVSLVSWALTHASALFTAAEVDALLKLRALPQLAASDTLHGLLVAAVAGLAPDRARALLKQAAPGLKQPPPAFVRAFARTLPSDRRVQAWLRSWSAGTCRPDPVARAALEGLAAAGAPGKAAIVRFLRRTKGAPWRQRPDLVRALADAAVKLGAPAARLACREHLRQVGCLKMTREGRSRAQAAVARAVALCTAELGRWSGAR
jgi:hypothetical protein